MANYSLAATGGKDLLTTFRYRIRINTSLAGATGLKQEIEAYSNSCDLPSASGSPLTWSMPGGMQNYQAGKRTINPISMTFVVDTKAGNESIYTVLEHWANATYDLNTGANKGKANYCTDGIYIDILGEDSQMGSVTAQSVKYTFQLLRAQVTQVGNGTLSGESNNLLTVSCQIVYDNFKVFNSKGDELRYT